VENIFVAMQSFLRGLFPERGRPTGKGSKKSNKMIIGLGGMNLWGKMKRIKFVNLNK
jgi:hypothetical protein